MPRCARSMPGSRWSPGRSVLRELAGAGTVEELPPSPSRRGAEQCRDRLIEAVNSRPGVQLSALAPLVSAAYREATRRRGRSSSAPRPRSSPRSAGSGAGETTPIVLAGGLTGDTTPVGAALRTLLPARFAGPVRPAPSGCAVPPGWPSARSTQHSPPELPTPGSVPDSETRGSPRWPTRRPSGPRLVAPHLRTSHRPSPLVLPGPSGPFQEWGWVRSRQEWILPPQCSTDYDSRKERATVQPSAELLVDAFGRIRGIVHRVVDGLTPEQLSLPGRPRDQLDRLADLAPDPRAGRSRFRGRRKPTRCGLTYGWFERFGPPLPRPRSPGSASPF